MTSYLTKYHIATAHKIMLLRQHAGTVSAPSTALSHEREEKLWKYSLLLAQFTMRSWPVLCVTSGR